MLLAPPTPTHAHSRALSPPPASTTNNNNNNINNSPPKRRPPTPPPLPRLPPMNEAPNHHHHHHHHYNSNSNASNVITPATSSVTLTPTRGRSPQSSHTPTTSSSSTGGAAAVPPNMGVPPSSQALLPAVTSSSSVAASFGVLSAAGSHNNNNNNNSSSSNNNNNSNSNNASSNSNSVVPGGGGGAPAATPPLHHPLLGYVPHGNKILSRNLNGTLAVTTQPNNESELQLYRVLQRANLLTYYDTFISQGGDDVQQLCEAGEEEFLEIMALVGMASKPLHVRRLQKALQEWVSNPPLFQIPLLPNLPPSVVAGFPSFAHRSLMVNSSSSTTPSTRPSPPMNTPAAAMLHNHNSNSPGKEPLSHGPPNNMGGSTSPRDGGPPTTPLSRDVGIGMGMMGGHGGSRGPSPSMPPSSIHMNSSGGHLPPSSITMQNCTTTIGPDKNPEFFLQIMKNAGCESPGLNYPPPSGSPVGGSPIGGNSPQGATPTLHEAQIARLAQAASELVANMPSLEPRKDAFTNKRKMSKELEVIMNMSEDDPRRMDEIRKYAAIYGRFDCKRKPEKPLTMHEVSVNEAAAQICKYMPALLTRRDELFPLARQVVRDSGYQYSKGHSRSQTVIGREDEQRAKRPRLDSGPDHLEYKQDTQWKKRHERLEAISDELRAMSEKAEDVRNSLTSGNGNVADLTQQMDAIHTRHAQLTLEQSELMKAQQKSYCSRPRSERSCSDETRVEDSDSQYSYSANNSPSQVISSSQGNIIAVANPALSLSSAMPQNHTHHLHDDDRHVASLYSVTQNHNSTRNNSNSIKQEPSSPGNPKQE